jgi:muramoyltetrapeptide carboxypeptidase
MIIPPKLQTGDKVGIVSTARKISMDEVEPAIKKFKDWGLKVVPGKNLFAEDNQFAGTDEERTADFQSMMDDPEIKAIICARGGYGTVRIIDNLDFTKI